MAEELRWLMEPFLVAAASDGGVSPAYRYFKSQKMAEDWALSASAADRKSYYVFKLGKLSSVHPQESKLYPA